MKALRNLVAALLGIGAVLAAMLVAPVVATAKDAGNAAAPRAVQAKAAKPFYRGCKRSGRFNEGRFDYTTDAVLAGRCATSRIKGINLISSYSGHHPSANKALDIMVNLKGSCSAGRATGNRVARYMMNNAGKHGVRYIIWKNSYWAAGSGTKKLSNWRQGMHSGSCTTRHYDHVHVAFR